MSDRREGLLAWAGSSGQTRGAWRRLLGSIVAVALLGALVWTLVRLWRQVPRGALDTLSVLYVGCSTGIIDSFLSRRLGQVLGVDIDEPAVEFASNRIPIREPAFRPARRNGPGV